MKKILLYFGIAFFIIPATAKAQFETVRDSVVQLYGIVMTADSLVGIPGSKYHDKRAKPRNHHK